MIQFNQLPSDLSDKICEMAIDGWMIDCIEDLYDITQHGYERTGSTEVLLEVQTDEYIRQPDSFTKESLDTVFAVANRLEDLCLQNVLHLDILGYVDDWIWFCVIWPLTGAGNPSRSNLELIEHALLWGKNRTELNHRAEREHVVFLDNTQLSDLPAVKPYSTFVREGHEYADGDINAISDGVGAWVHLYKESGPMYHVVDERCFVFLAEHQT